MGAPTHSPSEELWHPNRDRVQATNKCIFLSWGGDEALQYSKAAKEQIFDPTPGLRAFLSEQIEPAKYQSTLSTMNSIMHPGPSALLTNIALDRPWFLY